MWEADQIEEAVGSARQWLGYLPSVEQPRYNLFDRHIEPRILPACVRNGMGVTVWSPLAQGLLTGKYNNGIPKGTRGGDTMWLAGQITPENLARVKKLAEIAAPIDLTVAQLALAWILRLPEISCAIVGATKVEQLKENLGAAGVRLTAETIELIEEVINPDATEQ